ncbi:MAG: methionyl-tRNA formyltransferase [Deltaproteobacteria bacterium]|nr:methionyl-tRNA formyltransferase [Deltaproteobacteria bacterium]
MRLPEPLAKWKVVFMGTPSFAIPVLEKLIEKENVVALYTQPDRPRGRGQKTLPSPIKEMAQKYHIPCFQPPHFKSNSTVEELKNLHPDLIVVIAYGLFLPKSILDIPLHKTLNIHPSLLPKYRGAAPIQWALINGDHQTGVTILYVTPKMDAGDMLLQKKIEILEEDTCDSLQTKLSALGANLLIETISGLKNHSLTPIPQNPKEVSQAPKLSKEIGHIDWTKSARTLFNLIRGANPWPGTTTVLEKEPLKIHRARVTHETFQGKAGKIHSLTEDGIEVETCLGLLLLTEVQKPNKRKMKASEFLKGQKITLGSYLGTQKHALS